MHLGRPYPFHIQSWECEVQFWPGLVPQQLHVQTDGHNGDSWDLLAGGIVTDVGDPDVGGLPGDISYFFNDPLGVYQLRVLYHKVAISPKKYSVSMRMKIGLHANIASCEIGPEERSFGGYAWTLNSGASPPFFNGHSPGTQIRGATWSEV